MSPFPPYPPIDDDDSGLPVECETHEWKTVKSSDGEYTEYVTYCDKCGFEQGSDE